jgi:hypothetical protein
MKLSHGSTGGFLPLPQTRVPFFITELQLKQRLLLLYEAHLKAPNAVMTVLFNDKSKKHFFPTTVNQYLSLKQQGTEKNTREEKRYEALMALCNRLQGDEYRAGRWPTPPTDMNGSGSTTTVTGTGTTLFEQKAQSQIPEHTGCDHSLTK